MNGCRKNAENIDWKKIKYSNLRIFMYNIYGNKRKLYIDLFVTLVLKIAVS